jgi:acyl dehydratase
MAEKVYESPPSLLGLYGRAALGSIPGAGLVPFVGLGPGGDDVPDLELRVPEARTDRDRLAAYCRVCGFTLRETLPPTYPHMLAFPLHMALMTDPGFPFAAVGLVHIANRITQHRPIGAGETLAISVRATKLEPHPKGRQFSLLTEVRAGGELVWESVSTNLRRGRGEESVGEGGAGPFEGIDFETLPAAAEWKLGGDLGRRYAGVSGDRNPIHMYGLTAKPLGFSSQIAHGMWTKARCLAALEGELPGALTADVRFKRPILLPATVAFASAPSPGGAGIAFAVRDARKGLPHVEGLLTALG